MANKYIKDLTTTTNPSLTGHTIFDNGTTTYKTTLETLKNTIVDSVSHHFTGSQVISGSLTVTGSINFADFVNVDDSVRVSGNEYVSGVLVVGIATHHLNNPESLHVANTGSFNIAHFQGNKNEYTQLNVINRSSGSDASGDIVITANNGSESNLYINLGINSSNYTAGYVGYQNDGYLINKGNDLYIGSEGAVEGHNHVHIFSKGNWQTPAISVMEGNVVGFSTLSVSEGYKFEFSGSAKFKNNITNNGFTILSSVTSSFNNDTEAATGGVPLQGLYRSGSHILIRLT
jgi:hypothetical protein